jgi:hypothetical protein
LDKSPNYKVVNTKDEFAIKFIKETNQNWYHISRIRYKMSRSRVIPLERAIDELYIPISLLGGKEWRRLTLASVLAMEAFLQFLLCTVEPAP